jgi:hypothetical protein
MIGLDGARALRWIPSESGLDGRVAVLHPPVTRYCALHQRKVLRAFQAGLQVHDAATRVASLLTTRYAEADAPDVAVIYGVHKPSAPFGKKRIIEGQRSRGRRFVVLERGYLQRDRYYAAGWGGLNGRADFCNRGMPSDRFEALGLAIGPWRTDGDHVVLCGQVPTDASVQHVAHEAWLADTARALARATHRPILYRPHPLGPGRPVPGTTSSRGRSLEQDLEGAWACVTFSSNAAVDAALAGIPVFACDEGSMALAIANRDLSDIDRPAMPDREQWAFDLAYAQWTLEEFANGACWQHLGRGAKPSRSDRAASVGARRPVCRRRARLETRLR